MVVSLTTVTLMYASVQYIVIHTLSSAASASKPVAEAARHFMGPIGCSLIAVGALISVYGYVSANMLHTARLTFAMGDDGDLPRFVAAIHPRFRTPYVSIVTFAVALLFFSVVRNYQWNAILSATSRLFIYASIAAAVPILRRKQPHADAFRVTGATFFVVVALLYHYGATASLSLCGRWLAEIKQDNPNTSSAGVGLCNFPGNGAKISILPIEILNFT
jgi:APA family basic amino acid/polyamine antiporter